MICLFIYRFIDGSIDSLIVRSIHWLIDRLLVLSINPLIDRLIDWLRIGLILGSPNAPAHTLRDIRSPAMSFSQSKISSLHGDSRAEKGVTVPHLSRQRRSNSLSSNSSQHQLGAENDPCHSPRSHHPADHRRIGLSPANFRTRVERLWVPRATQAQQRLLPVWGLLQAHAFLLYCFGAARVAMCSTKVLDTYNRSENDKALLRIIDRSSIVCLTDCLTHWLIKGSIDWLLDRLVDWSIAWLIHWFIDWWIAWLINWLIKGSIGCSVDWFGLIWIVCSIDWWIDSSFDGLIVRLMDWLIDWAAASSPIS